MAISLTNASRCWKNGDLEDSWEDARVERDAMVMEGTCGGLYGPEMVR